MIDQVLIAKRLFSIGSTYSEEADPLSAGLAISLFQDSVELLVWCIAKHHSVAVKDNDAFTSLLEKIERISPDGVPHKAKMLELNKARVGFKHYGNLPASSESTKFRSYTQDFLVISCQRFLGINFDEVSLSSLIQIQKVREHVQNAEKSMGTPLPLCVLSLNQFKAIGGSDGLAPIGRPGYGRLADSKQFRYGHGRHA